MSDYFRSSINKAADKRASQVLMQKMHNKFSDIFSGIWCFEGTFSLQVKDDSWSYQAPLRRVAYILQEPLMEELDRLQKQLIIVSLGVDQTSEWCNSLDLVPKVNGKAWLCLDQARLNKVLIRPVDRGLILNDGPLRLAGVNYLRVIDASSGYHNLKLDKHISYLPFSCPFGRYRYIRITF